MSSEDDDSGAKSPAPFWLNIRRVSSLVRQCWGWSFVLLILMLSRRLSSMGESYFGGHIIDAFVQKDPNNFWYQTTLLAFSYLFSSAFLVVEVILIQIISSKIGYDVRERLYRALLIEKSQSFFDESKSGDLASRLSKDTQSIESDLGSWLPIVLTEIAHIAFGVWYLLSTSVKLSFAVALIIPAMSIVSWIQSKWETPLRDQQNKIVSETNSKTIETITQIKTVKIFGQQHREIRNFTQLLKQLANVSWKLSIVSGLSYGLLSACYSLILVVTFSYGGTLVLKEEISSGEFLAFCLFAISLSDSINTFPEFNTKLTTILTSSERIFSITESTSEIDLELIQNTPKRNPSITEMATRKHYTISGFIKFDNVTFNYPSRPDWEVLKQFNLIVEAGKSVAIVGPSGSGKSTIVSLLTKLYEISSGSISIDGIDIRNIDTEWLRTQIGLVTQEPVLFSGTVRENICYGIMEDYSNSTSEFKNALSQKVERVAKMANAHDFIMELPSGYDTIVGERGSLLSAGQRQRIAIARAIMRDPKILIADEATSSLDNNSERVVQEALERLMEGRTSIVIAHRLSTIRRCEKICVMDKGQIQEIGTHNELLKNPNGLYSKLHHHYEAETEKMRSSQEILDVDPSIQTRLVDDEYTEMELMRHIDTRKRSQQQD